MKRLSVLVVLIALFSVMSFAEPVILTDLYAGSGQAAAFSASPSWTVQAGDRGGISGALDFATPASFSMVASQSASQGSYYQASAAAVPAQTRSAGDLGGTMGAQDFSLSGESATQAGVDQ